ncbi:hypothetical protein M1N57_00265 [Dehalococcoidales bacterium]|nr:hypothetical protein [Dehalococcoidales bacterium]
MKGNYLSSKAVQKLLAGIDIDDPRELQRRRNRIAFTLALIFRDGKLSKEEALKALVWWDKRNKRPLRKPEKAFRRIIDYIYSPSASDEKASWHWIEILSGEKVEEKFKPLFSDLKPGELKRLRKKRAQR